MLEDFNIAIFHKINDFVQLTFLNQGIIIFAKYLPYIFILSLIYLWFTKNNQIKKITLLAGYTAIVGILINYSITVFYHHNRPFADHIGHVLIQHSADSSFPSDHTTFMLSLGFAFLYFTETKKIGISLLVLGFLGGISRVYCGVHYPFDIIGSIIVSFIASFAIFKFRSVFSKTNNRIIKLYTKTKSIIST